MCTPSAVMRGWRAADEGALRFLIIVSVAVEFGKLRLVKEAAKAEPRALISAQRWVFFIPVAWLSDQSISRDFACCNLEPCGAVTTPRQEHGFDKIYHVFLTIKLGVLPD